ncbi:MAG: proton-conducting transporter membrane subunit, partial [Chthoniobacterales bacterium]
FKALLFLGAGSIIIMLHHEQNIWMMGALAGKLRITFLTFLVGTLALIGCPPFSGFFSKEAILALAHEKSMPIFVLALCTAFLTAFYMLRLVRCGTGWKIAWAVFVLARIRATALPAALAGFGLVANNFLTLPHGEGADQQVPILAGAAMVAGVILALLLYRNRESDPLDFALIRHRFYFDELYAWLISVTQELLAAISAFLDRWIIDAGGVRGASGATWGFGSLLRLFQVGNLQAYSFLFGLGVIGLIYFTIFR